MKQMTTLLPGEEVLDQIPAAEIKEITVDERTTDGRRLVRTTGGSLWLAMRTARFERHGLELVLKGHFQQLVEVSVRMRERMHRPAVRC
jgi:hypothetical protein